MPGTIYLIGTPIGNLGDLSPRAVETLRNLDILYCEDTRHTNKLLTHFGITVPSKALHDDSPPQHWTAAVQQAALGKRIGYVTDAGMPGISDPGRRLLRAAWEAGVRPAVIPGPTAVATLASYCPFIESEFCFLGFAPRKKAELEALAANIAGAPRPIVLFDSPQRIHNSLEAIASQLEPDREVVVARELTKLHEQVLLFHAGDWPGVAPQIPAKGEFTIAVARAPRQPLKLDQGTASAAVARLQAAGFSRRDALKAAAAVLELPANALKKLGYTE